MSLTPILKSRIPSIIAAAEGRAALAVEKTAFLIEGGCKQRSRVDTGEMQNGWQTSINGPVEREVGNAVEHTLYNEFSTSTMSAQPMLAPSVEEQREPFERAMAQVYV